MANLLRLRGESLTFVHQGHSLTLQPNRPRLAEGLEAYGQIRLDIQMQSRPLEERREVTRFLAQFGQLLFHTLFPAGQESWLEPRQPLLLELEGDWLAYPWELLRHQEQWLALEQGVVRLHPAPAAAPPQGHDGAPVRLLAVTARPLLEVGQGAPAETLAAHYGQLGAKFISVADGLQDPLAGSHHRFRPLEHASMAAFAQALESHPHLLHFSGFAYGEGWLFEGAANGPERTGAAWLVERLGQAARQGLQALVANDSLGLLEPAKAALQTRLFLETGLPAVIRLVGRTARLREQDYLRTLTRQLAQSGSLLEAHLAALRRLHRRFEEGWDWSFFSYSASSPPLAAEEPRRAARLVAWGQSGPGAERQPPALDGGFCRLPAPIPFNNRRRQLGRHSSLPELIRAFSLPKGGGPAQPLVFLTGPAGCGKTTLALATARRLKRDFEEIGYLAPRQFLPVAPQEATGQAPLLPVQRLLGELARRLGGWSVLDGPPEQWGQGLRRLLDDGKSRLLLLDRLEKEAGYQLLVEALGALTPNNRVVLISRKSPPLLPGVTLALPRASKPTLEEVFGRELVERLEKKPQLYEAARSDLLLARLLARLPHWPGLEGEAAKPEDEQGGRSGLLRRAAQLALRAISPAALAVARALCLNPGPIHRETLASLTGMDETALSSPLIELLWTGLAEAYDNERYYALNPRLQGMLEPALMKGEDYREWLGRLTHAACGWLSGLRQTPPDERAPIHLWRDGPLAPFQEAGARAAQRLGVESANIAELGWMLYEEGDLERLERLVAHGAALTPWRAGRPTQLLLCQWLIHGAQRAGLPQAEGQGRLRLGEWWLAAGNPQAAQPELDKAMGLASRQKDWNLLFQAYLELARCHVAQGRAEAAHNLLHAALELAQQTGSGEFLVGALEPLLELSASHPQWRDEGIGLAKTALEKLTQQSQGFQAARAQRLLAQAMAVQGRAADSQPLFRQALEGFKLAGAKEEAGKTLLALAQSWLDRQDTEQAWSCLASARGLLPPGAALVQTAKVVENWAQALQERGEAREALKGYVELRRLYEEMGDREALARALDQLGGLYFQMGDKALSTRCYQERLSLQPPPPAAPQAATHRAGR